MYPYMKHGVTGEFKTVPTGFAWTVLLFGFFVPLFRGDLKWAAIMFCAALISGGLANIAFAFAYNSLYRDELFQQGFRPAQDGWSAAAQPQHIVQQVYVNTGDGFAQVAPQPQAYDPFAERAAAAYARDPAPPAPHFMPPVTVDATYRQQPPRQAGFGRKGV